MTSQHYCFRDILNASARVDWRVEDLIGGVNRLDFAKPFLPEALARVRPLGFLDARELRLLNQIRGHAYLGFFGLAETFILPFVLDHARASLDGDDDRTRALLQFAAEEAKHIQLFKRFRKAFVAGFGSPCEVIGPPQAIAKAVLAHAPLAVALLVLHLEWMTQRHYTDSIRDNQELDETFKNLLKHHWLEEAQHARLDTLLVRALSEGLDAAALDKIVLDYLAIVGFLDQGLKQQVELDLAAFERVSGRRLAEAETAAFRAVQHQANRWTYLGSGMTHRNFATTLAKLHPCGAAQVAAVAKLYA